jgi:hypothetical protein
VLELRRVFHGAAMSVGAIGPVEAASYALLVLALACVAAFGARAMRSETALASDLRAVVRPAAWTAALFAAFVLLVVRHAWWGVHSGEPTGDAAMLAATLAQFVACGLALGLGRALSIRRGADPTRFAAAALAAVCAWSFGHAGIRWLHHRGAMDDGVALAGIEGVAHALWPLAFVSAAAWATARAPGRDTIRAYLFDLQALWAAAIWPALVFAALGLWALFNPWWGALPGDVSSPMAAALMLAACLIASALSAAAPRVPHVRWSDRLIQVSAIAWTGHLFVAVTLAVRWLHHGEQMRDAPVIAAEMWMLAAAWAVLAAALWFTRPQRKPDLSAGVLTVNPGARRERRYGRRQRS